MEQVKTNDSVWIDFHTPLGSIREQASVIAELRGTESCSYTRYMVALDDREIDISLAMFAAIEQRLRGNDSACVTSLLWMMYSFTILAMCVITIIMINYE